MRAAEVPQELMRSNLCSREMTLADLGHSSDCRLGTRRAKTRDAVLFEKRLPDSASGADGLLRQQATGPSGERLQPSSC